MPQLAVATIPIFDDSPCACFTQPGECVCPVQERALRNFTAGNMSTPMTPDQREWCLKEIDQVEGYRRADYEREGDENLARGVLNAWTDYCRDKGLL